MRPAVILKSDFIIGKNNTQQYRNYIRYIDRDDAKSKTTTESIDAVLNYTNRVIHVVEEKAQLLQIPAVKEKINLVKEEIADINDETDYSEDPDARKGYKSSDCSFLGYKTHIGIPVERIITAAVIISGDRSDAKQFKELVENIKKHGMNVQQIIGDRAYSSKGNLIYTQHKIQQLISRLHPVITNGKRNSGLEFEFNKDVNIFVYPAGHLATSKYVKKVKNSSRNTHEKYYFDIEICEVCLLRQGCYKDGVKTKTYSIRIKSSEHIA